MQIILYMVIIILPLSTRTCRVYGDTPARSPAATPGVARAQVRAQQLVNVVHSLVLYIYVGLTQEAI